MLYVDKREVQNHVSPKTHPGVASRILACGDRHSHHLTIQVRLPAPTLYPPPPHSALPTLPPGGCSGPACCDTRWKVLGGGRGGGGRRLLPYHEGEPLTGANNVGEDWWDAAATGKALPQAILALPPPHVLVLCSATPSLLPRPRESGGGGSATVLRYCRRLYVPRQHEGSPLLPPPDALAAPSKGHMHARSHPPKLTT